MGLSVMPVPGDRIGHILLVDVLGEGGMGTVYAGLDEKLNREVAVKAIRMSRFGSRARARLLREARALSQLDHPNICRIHEFIEKSENDYLVLERIRGSTLREVLDRGAGDLPKLRIAEEIALALAAAHERGVVHRDLKPRNVMLTEDGRVKVLDFGLARQAGDLVSWEPEADDQELHETAQSEDSTETVTRRRCRPGSPENRTGLDERTRAGAIVGTAAYMSPEQARGEETTAASDVYSFGLVLQELFTGLRPFSQKLSSDELLEAAATGDSLPVTGVEPEIAGLIRRMKAIAPEARPTASEVADRLRRRRGRARRRALRIAVAAVVLLAIAAFLKYTFDLRRERSAALAARNEAEQVASFMVDVFRVAEPEQSRGSTVTARELLDQGAERVRQGLGDQPHVKARLMLTIGQVYRRLGLYKEAAELIEEALARRESLVGNDHPDVAQCLVSEADVYAAQGRFAEATAAGDRAVAIYEKELGPQHPELARSLTVLGTVHLRQGHYEEAEALFVRSLGILESDPEADPQTLADTLANLAVLYRQRGDLGVATDYSERALAVRQRIMGPDHPDLALSHNNLAVLLYVQGRLAESAEQLERALAIWERALGPDHPNVATCVNNLGELAWKRGQYAESEALFLRALAIWEKTVGPDHPDTAFALHGLANLYRDTGRYDEAEALYRRAITIRESSLTPDHPDLVAVRQDADELARITHK